ncbi:MAG TPA: flagellar basal body rod protein FlgC [Longimicrobiaceae bacterium]|nr:flagellar basal body rod protein FlgC [Longimicrobiaceae bacterium]
MINNNGFPPDPYKGIVRPMFRTLGIAASGLSAQRTRLDVIASNIANAETTRANEDGAPYQRQIVRMAARGNPWQPYEVNAAGNPAEFRLASGDPVATMHGVMVDAVEADVTEGPLVYEPGHPDADANGYVRYPNVRITDELVDLMDARRVYEANATVFQSAKAMLRRALEI